MGPLSHQASGLDSCSGIFGLLGLEDNKSHFFFMQEESAIRRNQSPLCMTSQTAEARKRLGRGLRCELGTACSPGEPLLSMCTCYQGFSVQGPEAELGSPTPHPPHLNGWAVQSLDGSLGVLRCPEGVLGWGFFFFPCPWSGGMD